MLFDSALLNKIRHDELVVFAGAGLSMAAPSALPDWVGLNSLIFNVLCDRYEQCQRKPGFLKPIRTLVDSSKPSVNFPPDYQMQLLHEYCGEDYFKLLQCVDVTVINSDHEMLAQLVLSGQVKVIVTTSIDRLIEQALAAIGVEFHVAFDEETYESCFLRMNESTVSSKVEVIKVHGCVQDHLSLVDTLKRRLRGRNRFLDNCLAHLLAQHCFLYVGFSARDLESDPDYLGLKKAARQSPGLVYVKRPGTSELSQGAVALMSAYGSKSTMITAPTYKVFGALLGDENSEPIPPPSQGIDGVQRVEQSLIQITQCLSSMCVLTCLAAALEAEGNTRAAFGILHDYGRGVLTLQREEPGLDRMRLLQVRSGVALGLLDIEVPGSENQLEVSLQSLSTVREQDRRADAWLGLARVWGGRVDEGYQRLLSSLMQTHEHNDPLEYHLDCWLAVAEYRFFSSEGVDVFEDWQERLALAENSADLARLARVAAMVYLHLCDGTTNVAKANQTYQQVLLPQVFSRSARINDPVSEGLTALARARWFNHQACAVRASEVIDVAMQKFSQAGMVRWYEFARIERSSTLVNQEEFDDAAKLLDNIAGSVAHHVLLKPRFYATRAKLHIASNNPKEAAKAYKAAVTACELLGMHKWKSIYSKAYNECQETVS
ncbi:MAG: SIR2 family protein [Granulosicoccus sp.]